MNVGPTKGPMFHTRITQVSFESERAHIADSLVAIMKEFGLTFEDIAFELNVTEDEAKYMVMTKDLTLSELSKLAGVMHMEYYTLFRPNRMRTEV